MKTFLNLAAFSILVLSCSYSGLEPEHLECNAGNNRVTTGDLSAYLKAYKGIDESTKAIEVVEVIPILNDADTVMYIVNYEDGWDVLSADKRAPVVLMTCESGYATEELLKSNPAQTEYVDCIKDAMSGLIANPSAPVVSESDNWKGVSMMKSGNPNDLSSWVKVGTQLDRIDTLANQDHLLRTHWGQSGSWGVRAPFRDSFKRAHCPTGCVMVAGSQVLYYLHYKLGVPAKTYGDCTCSAFIPDGKTGVVLNDSNISFDESSYSDVYWDLMPLDKSSASSFSSYVYVSTLMSRIGYLVGANYGAISTGAVTRNLANAFIRDYSINCKVSNIYDADTIREQVITQNMPCIFAIGNESWGGHAVIADGCRYLRYHIKVYYRYADEHYSSVRYEMETRYNNFFAINWGWDGSADYDSASKSTIWYNAETVNWRGYNEFRYMLYDFTSK